MSDTKNINISLADLQVTLSSTEWVLEIHFSNNEREQYTLQIESPFTLKMSSGESMDLEPSRETATLPALTEAVDGGAKDITAHHDGSLDVQFKNHVSVSVPPSDDFEAWNLADAAGPKFVSLPGGGLSTWGA